MQIRNTKIWIGIDPGAKGACVVMNSGNSDVKIYMPDKIIEALKQHYDAIVLIEKAQAMPGQGVCAMFTYGQGFGELIGMCKAFGSAYALIPPKTWQKELFLGTLPDMKPKERALIAAQRLFPKVNLLETPRCRKPHDGIVDALLICEFARRHF